MKSIYLAGPITGLTFGACTDWREYVKTKLMGSCIECFSPMRGKEYLKNEEYIKSSYKNITTSTQKGIMTRDRFDTTQCDILVVNLLEAQKVSIGTVMEIAWADMLRKPIILIMEKDNIHDHPMLNEAAGFTVNNLDEAVDLIKIILNP